MNPEILKFPIWQIDTHIHTRHSCDSDLEPTDACRRARDLGLRALIFTEHVDFDPSDEGFGFYDALAIDNSLNVCRQEFPDLTIFRGVEVTYQSKFRKQIERFLKNGRFDYTIGSVHIVGAGDISRAERQGSYFFGRSESEAYRPYFVEVLAAAESGLFDAIGHLDLCKKYGHGHYGPFDWNRYRSEVEAILRAAVAGTAVLELNTSGMRQAPQDTYPNLDIIEIFLGMGGRILLGSDAHRAQDIGFAFDRYRNIGMR